MMPDEAQLRDKLRKIEALFAGAGTSGERLAAEAAIKDEATFKAEWGKVMGNCGACHKEYRKAK